MNDYTSEDTIFVQIASYRDPELQCTLKDLFEKAKRPENIFVGICHQYDMKGDEDKHLFEIPFSHPEQLRIDNVDYRESQGCCWARNRVQKLWKGEKYTFIIDAHTRFVKNWDEQIVKIQKKIGDKSILTQWAPNYNKATNQCESKIGNGELGVCCSRTTIYHNDNINQLSMAVCLHFCFGKSKIISFSPIPILQSSDELIFSFFCWLQGANIFVCKDHIINHYCPNDQEKKDVKSKTINRTYNRNIDKIFDFIFERKQIKDQNIIQIVNNHINHIHFDSCRNLRDYERFSGANFKLNTLREHCKYGIFEEWQEVSKIKNIKNIFTGVYKL